MGPAKRRGEALPADRSPRLRPLAAADSSVGEKWLGSPGSGWAKLAGPNWLGA